MRMIKQGLGGLALLGLAACTTPEFEPIAAPPELISPVHQWATSDAFVTFEWQAVDDVQRYQLVIDGEPVLTTASSSATVNLFPRTEAYCWQVFAQDALMQYPSVRHCLHVTEPEFCVDQTGTVSWPADPNALSYRVTILHQESGNTETLQRSRASFRVGPSDAPGRYIWQLDGLYADGETRLGESSYVIHGEVAIESIELAGREAPESDYVFSWEAPVDQFNLELIQGTCDAPGSVLTGWPKEWHAKQIALRYDELPTNTPLAFRVTAAPGGCAGPPSCLDFESHFCDMTPIPNLTWHDVTPAGYLPTPGDPFATWEPSIVYDESTEAFLVVAGDRSQLLRVGSNLDVEHRLLDVDTDLNINAAMHVEGVLVYDSISQQSLLLYDHEIRQTGFVYSLDLKTLDPWQRLPADSGDVPILWGDHVAIFDPRNQRVIMYDPFDLTELWELDLKPSIPDWKPIDAGGTVPADSGAMNAWYDENRHRLVTFGGFDFDFSSARSDVYALDLETHTWEYIETTGVQPGPRFESGGTQFGCHFFVTHGAAYEASGAEGQILASHYDAFILLDHQQWVKPKVNGDIPGPDWGFDAAWDPINRVVLVVGGGAESPNLSQVYMITGF